MSIESAGIISDRRKKRWVSKKRKLEAFLNLVATDESDVNKVPKLVNDDEINDENMKEIRQMSLSIRRQKEEEPKFYLTEHGLNAQVNFKFYNREKPLGETVAPLFVLDIQQLLLKALLCSSTYNFNFRWGKFESVKKIKNVVLFIIDGLSKDAIIRHMSYFPNAIDIFSDMVEVLTSFSYTLNFATELSGVHLTLGYRPSPEELNDGIGICTSQASLTSVFSGLKESNVIVKDFDNEKQDFSKLHLLLNPLQLALENFPLPDNVLEGSNTKDYCFSKDIYSPVTEDSPMFALDCEMCRMKSGNSEVIKIAVIDEQLNVIYNTLVKPKGPVDNYLTKYSGVDEEMLKPIKTTLSDVQMTLKKLLPADAIICGQSLNFDLHALKMIHPYIIDTSVIYNMSGRRHKKTGLRILSEVFLNEVIQDNEKGHDPIEDCVAAMKLVQLKLKNGPIFGDAILADCKKSNRPTEITKPNYQNKKEMKLNSGSKLPEEVQQLLSESELSVRFFSKLQNEGKKLTIITDSLSYAQYSNGMVASSINKTVETSMKKVIKKGNRVMKKNDLTVCHITPILSQKSKEDLYADMDKFIKKLYTACSDKSLFITVATGAANNDNNYENGLCMLRIKNEAEKNC